MVNASDNLELYNDALNVVIMRIYYMYKIYIIYILIIYGYIFILSIILLIY